MAGCRLESVSEGCLFFEVPVKSANRMSNQHVHLSVIVPIYHAEPFLIKTLEDLDAFFQGLALSAELILVEDGGRDRSYEIAMEWARAPRSYRVRVLKHEQNQGKGGAVATGMLAAQGLFRIFLDADLAYPPSQILRILEALEDGADVAVACRVHPDSRYTISPAFFHYLYTRHLASRAINWAMRHMVIPNCSDSQAGLKGFRAQAAETIFSRQTVKGFPFDVEALFLASKMGCRIREVGVEFRYFNEPTTVAFMQDGVGMLRDVARVRLHHLRGRYQIKSAGRRCQLLINADDFGMTLATSRGILAAVAGGAVRSTSVMTNTTEFDASMDLLAHASIKPSLGFHATLTWGRPLSNPGKVRSLTDRDGAFLSRGKLLMRALRGAITESEVVFELRAQFERLLSRTPEITHVDGHHHVHAFPVISGAVATVAREFGIRLVRAPFEGSWTPGLSGMLRRRLVATLPASRPAYWIARGFVCPDHFGGFALGAGKGLRQRWDRVVDRLPNGITEIMVHPGYASEQGDVYNREREEELALLADPEFAQAITTRGVELISFRDLQNSKGSHEPSFNR